MKAQNTPGGMALGHASGDGNAWVHWCLWAFGGNLVDANDKVIINSPETEKALNYAKQLYETLHPRHRVVERCLQQQGVPGRRGLTGPTTACRSTPPPRRSNMKEMVDDIDHALWPVGPVGKPTEFHIAYPIMIMTYSKFPQASKAFIAFMMEAANLDPWVISRSAISRRA